MYICVVGCEDENSVLGIRSKFGKATEVERAPAADEHPSFLSLMIGGN